MSLPFLRAKPLQACKLAAIVATLLFAVGGTFGLIPDRGFTGLLLVVTLGFGLVLVIAVETLVAGYRSITAAPSLADQFASRRVYSVVRAVEVVGAVLSAGGFVSVIAWLPDGPMSGPGAIGLLFIVAALGLLVLGGSLVRTLAEYYYYRHNRAA